MSDALAAARPALVRRGLRLNYFTLAYNTAEAIVSIAAGVVAGSVALVGFGVDSGIEVTASVAAQWRLRADIDPVRRERVERVTVGLVILVLSVVVMPILARALQSRALEADAFSASSSFVIAFPRAFYAAPGVLVGPPSTFYAVDPSFYRPSPAFIRPSSAFIAIVFHVFGGSL